MQGRRGVTVLMSTLVPALATLALVGNPYRVMAGEGNPEKTQRIWRAQIDSGKGAAAAGRCTKLADCPTFDEVFTNTPPFRHALAEALRRGGQSQPDWVVQHDGASPMMPVLIDDRPYLVGRVHDPKAPHHWLAALYDPEKGWIVVRYGIHGDKEPLWFGNPQQAAGTDDQQTQALRKVLAAYLDPDRALGRAAARADTPLPVPIDTKQGWASD